jgi:hypothetical protein
MPVNRWIPADSGDETPTSDDQRSCSSPPPTRTAPTSVSSQRSRASPFVSVSTARNSAVASGCVRRSAEARSVDMGQEVIRLGSDGTHAALHRLAGNRAGAPPSGYRVPR